MKIAVVGAGIIGISSAYRIKTSNSHLNVTVIADQFTPYNTSDGAVGNLIPLDDGGTPEDLLLRWYQETRDRCQYLMSTNENAANMGLSVLAGTYIMKTKQDFPKWAKHMNEFVALSHSELKQFNVPAACGFTVSVNVCEGAKYIPCMMKEFVALGGKLVKRKIKDLSELSNEYDIVVNCTGMASKWLVKDDKMFAVRGQTIRVKAPWVKKYLVYISGLEDRICAILPNQDSCVLGVTFQKDNYSTVVSTEDREWLLNETAKLLPSIKNAPILWDWVGLRPGREGVRLERENLSYKEHGFLKVIHNYGHSASGISLHWGCAGDVVKLVKECLSEFKSHL